MKKTRFFMLGVVVSMMPSVMQAQEQIQKAIDQFVSSNKVSSYVIEHNDGNDSRDFMKEYKFCLDKHSGKQLERLKKAFLSDRKGAYLQIQNNKNSKRTLRSIAGINNQNIEVGSSLYDNNIQQYYMDTKDPTRRYAYAMEWTEKRSGAVEGRLIAVLSKKPGQKNQKRSYIIKFDEADSILNNADWDKLNNIDWSKTNVITTGPSENFLATFINYRRLIGRSPNSSATPYYVNSLYKACKKAPKLDVHEKRMLTKELDRLCQVVKDNFLKEMILSAKRYINTK